jgi:hypothetical protein
MPDGRSRNAWPRWRAQDETGWGPWPLRIRASATVWMVTLVVGCSSTRPADIIPVEGIVYGSVIDGQGIPQPFAGIGVSTFIGMCDGRPPFIQDSTNALSDGTYRSLLRGPNFSSIGVCLEVRGTTATTAGVSRGAFLTLYSTASGKVDSVRVDMIVR